MGVFPSPVPVGPRERCAADEQTRLRHAICSAQRECGSSSVVECGVFYGDRALTLAARSPFFTSAAPARQAQHSGLPQKHTRDIHGTRTPRRYSMWQCDSSPYMY